MASPSHSCNSRSSRKKQSRCGSACRSSAQDLAPYTTARPIRAQPTRGSSRQAAELASYETSPGLASHRSLLPLWKFWRRGGNSRYFGLRPAEANRLPVELRISRRQFCDFEELVLAHVRENLMRAAD